MSYKIYEGIHTELDRLPLFGHPTKTAPNGPALGEACPDNGVYFYYEFSEEYREQSKYRQPYPRIVRVGTHDSSQGLGRRLRNHYQKSTRNSVFRNRVYQALCNSRWDFRNVYNDDDKKEAPAKYLENYCWFKVLGTPSEVEANDLERRLIPSLAAYSGQFISPEWLGNYSDDEKVRRTGMWNSEYTERFDLEFDDKYVEDFVRLVNSEKERISHFV